MRNAPPATPELCGSTKPSIACTATAASSALPPCLRISMPASTASGFAAATHGWSPRCRWRRNHEEGAEGVAAAGGCASRTVGGGGGVSPLPLGAAGVAAGDAAAAGVGGDCSGAALVCAAGGDGGSTGACADDGSTGACAGSVARPVSTASRVSARNRFNIGCTSSRPKPRAYIGRLTRGITHLHRGHPGGGGAGPQPFHEGADGGLIAARQYLHAAVGQIARVAVDPQLTGTARGCGAIKNPLHPAAHHTLLAHHL